MPNAADLKLIKDAILDVFWDAPQVIAQQIENHDAWEFIVLTRNHGWGKISFTGQELATYGSADLRKHVTTEAQMLRTEMAQEVITTKKKPRAY